MEIHFPLIAARSSSRNRAPITFAFTWVRPLPGTTGPGPLPRLRGSEGCRRHEKTTHWRECSFLWAHLSHGLQLPGPVACRNLPYTNPLDVERGVRRRTDVDHHVVAVDHAEYGAAGGRRQSVLCGPPSHFSRPRLAVKMGLNETPAVSGSRNPE